MPSPLPFAATRRPYSLSGLRSARGGLLDQSAQLVDHRPGGVREDLRAAYGWAVEEFSAPEAVAALPGLLADLAANPELARLVRSLVIEPEYARVRTMLERGQERGEIRRDADLTLAIDAFTGTALARVLLLDRPVEEAFGERMVALMLRGLAPGAT